MPDRKVTSASVSVPSKEGYSLSQLTVRSLTPPEIGGTLLTATEFETVSEGRFQQTNLSQINLPPGGSLTPSLVQEAIAKVRRNEAFLEATWTPDEESDEVIVERALVGRMRGHVVAAGETVPPSFDIGETGAKVAATASSFGYDIDLPAARYEVSVSLLITPPLLSEAPAIKTVSLVGDDDTPVLQLSGSDPLTFHAGGVAGTLSDSDPAFRALRSFAFSAMHNDLKVLVTFKGIDEVVRVPLYLTNPLP